MLDCARLGDSEMRVNAAAMLLFLGGKASKPFDWEQRPLFLQFGTDNPAELRASWEELRQRSGV